MKKAKKLKGAEALGMKIKVSKSMKKLSGKVLFPEKVNKANEIIGKLNIKSSS